MFAVLSLECCDRGAGDPGNIEAGDLIFQEDAHHALEGLSEFASVPWDQGAMNVLRAKSGRLPTESGAKESSTSWTGEIDV